MLRGIADLCPIIPIWVSLDHEAFVLDRKREKRSLHDARRGAGHLWVRAVLGADRGKHEQAKPLKGFGSTDVLEVVERSEGGSFRAIYTVRFAEAIYVLHCFQKKSTRGIATPKPDIDKIHEPR